MNLKDEINDFENQEDFYLNSKQNNNLLEMEMDISLVGEKKNDQPKKMFSKNSDNTNMQNQKKSTKFEHFS